MELHDTSGINRLSSIYRPVLCIVIEFDLTGHNIGLLLINNIVVKIYYVKLLSGISKFLFILCVLDYSFITNCHNRTCLLYKD
jgi:hypothetical protein